MVMARLMLTELMADVTASYHVPQEKDGRHEALASRLRSPHHVDALHLDAATGHFADWGNHTQNVSLSWRAVRGPQGEIVGREVARTVTGQPPQPQYVPHYG